MKIRKNGLPTISKEVWLHNSALHRQFGDALIWLTGRSLDTLLNEASDEKFDVEYKAADVNLQALMMLRIRVEAQVANDAENDGLSLAEKELRCLIGCLMRWSSKESSLAETSRKIASEIRRGRPEHPRSDPANLLANPLASIFNQRRQAPPRRRGRKSEVDISDTTLLRMLQENRERGRKDIDTLRVFVTLHFRSLGKHTAGGDIERIAKNLQKRAAEARKVVRK